MNEVLLSAGVASIIIAIVGGGAQAFGVNVPVLQSRARQAALGLVGVAFLVTAVVVGEGGGNGSNGDGQLEVQAGRTLFAGIGFRAFGPGPGHAPP